jgi:hypothetical protein
MDKLFEKPAKGPVFLLNLRKLFQKLKFWNSLSIKNNRKSAVVKIILPHISCRSAPSLAREISSQLWERATPAIYEKIMARRVEPTAPSVQISINYSHAPTAQ